MNNEVGVDSDPELIITAALDNINSLDALWASLLRVSMKASDLRNALLGVLVCCQVWCEAVFYLYSSQNLWYFSWAVIISLQFQTKPSPAHSCFQGKFIPMMKAEWLASWLLVEANWFSCGLLITDQCLRGDCFCCWYRHNPLIMDLWF